MSKPRNICHRCCKSSNTKINKYSTQKREVLTSKPFCDCSKCECKDCPDILKELGITVTSTTVLFKPSTAKKCCQKTEANKFMGITLTPSLAGVVNKKSSIQQKVSRAVNANIPKLPKPIRKKSDANNMTDPPFICANIRKK